MAYDSTRAAAVTFSGDTDAYTGSGNDTWEYSTPPSDDDCDGTANDEDACPDSDLRDKLIIGHCDTGVRNELVGDGCTMGDRVAECLNDPKNHDDLANCVGEWTMEWVNNGILYREEAAAIRGCVRAPGTIPRQAGQR